MSFRFALVGNPNCGKTTLFNEITGSTQYVGNRPGVTIEKIEGKARKMEQDIRIVDLPGIYSLSPYSMEEIVARDYLLDEKPDVIVNIVDATNIERNLYLTTQVMELGIPVVVALNMMDAIEARGDVIDIDRLQKALGIPVIATSANKGRGIRELMQKALEIAQIAKKSETAIFTYDEAIEKALDQVQAQCSKAITKLNYNGRWVALKLLEGDEKAKEKMNLPGPYMRR